MTSRFSSAVFGFLFGVWLASLWPFGYALAGLAFLLALDFLIWRVGWGRDAEQKEILFLAIIFCLAAGVGLARLEWSWSRNLPPTWTTGTTTRLTGLILDEPKVSERSAQFILRTDAGAQLLVQTGLYPAYHYGDKLTVTGKLSAPQNFLTTSGQEFDYENYLARQRIYFQMFTPQIEVLATGQGNWFRAKLLRWRENFLHGLDQVLPEPESALLGGLLLGAKRSLDPAILAQFQRVGVSHMIVLSGYNLTVVAEAVRAVLGFLPLGFNLSLAGGGVIFFALLAGGGAAVWRATLMALLALWARATGRTYDALRALALAVVLMLLLDPTYLVFDLSFQLSLLATLGLILLSPLVERWWRFLPARGGWREIMTSTTAAQLAVLPWLIFVTGNFSLVALVVNPLVLIVVPTIMALGFLAGLLALFSHLLALIPGSLAYGLLFYQLHLVAWFSAWPLAAVSWPHFPLVLTLIIYAVIIWWYRKSTAVTAIVKT